MSANKIFDQEQEMSSADKKGLKELFDFYKVPMRAHDFGPATESYSFNKKQFLTPNAANTMSAVHIKIKQKTNGIEQYQMRISDCNNAIKLWGDLHTKEDVLIGIEKLTNLSKLATELKSELQNKLIQFKS